MPPWIWSSAKYYEIFYIQAVKGMNLQYYIAIVKAKKTQLWTDSKFHGCIFCISNWCVIDIILKERGSLHLFCKIENKNETRQY